MAAVDHLIIYLHGELQLLQRDDSDQFNIMEKSPTPANGDPYVLLKITSHFSITLYELLKQVIRGKIPLTDLPKETEPLRTRIERLRNDYSEVIAEVKPTLDLILGLLNLLTDCKNCSEVEKYQADYLDNLRPNLASYAEKATAYQLHGLHQISTQWLNDHHLNLEKTYIIIVGARGPKKDLIEHQYFHALRAHHGIADKNTPSGGIIYSEMLPKQMKDISIGMLVDDLARDIHNMQIGVDMLGDKQAMFKDVLGRYAPPVLKQLLHNQPQEQRKCPIHSMIPGYLYKFFSAPLKEEKSNTGETTHTMQLR